jgi:DUF971 family protein
MSTPHPVQMTYKQDERTLHIEFSDGFEASYALEHLRGYCPCAHCQGHGGEMLEFNQLRWEKQITISDVSQVGAYAVCVAWEDGHSTGVYSFDLLRTLAETPSDRCKDYPPDPDDIWVDSDPRDDD